MSMKVTPRRRAQREPLATTEEVADYLGITPRALIQMRYLGKAPKATKVGRRLRWRWKDIDAFLDQAS
ncbi:helix-turn-helix domain-containing protein [Micromonospora sp. NPDC005652]|uniref:helix-turn-helix transcriptional regulator n=1 Tax=Micromonospora sp. NPDC005652 TaxID=3157046 RepID=UPI00340E67E8